MTDTTTPTKTKRKPATGKAADATRDRTPQGKPKQPGEPGRPPAFPVMADGKVDPEYLQRVEDIAALGVNQEQIAIGLAIGESTLSGNKARYPEIADAIKKGKARFAIQAAYDFQQRFVNGKDTAIDHIFRLKQTGWQDERSVKHSGQVEHVLTPAQEAYKRRIEAQQPGEVIDAETREIE